MVSGSREIGRSEHCRLNDAWAGNALSRTLYLTHSLEEAMKGFGPERSSFWSATWWASWLLMITARCLNLIEQASRKMNFTVHCFWMAIIDCNAACLRRVNFFHRHCRIFNVPNSPGIYALRAYFIRRWGTFRRLIVSSRNAGAAPSTNGTPRWHRYTLPWDPKPCRFKGSTL